MEAIQQTEPQGIHPTPTPNATLSPEEGGSGSEAHSGSDRALVLQPTHLSDSSVAALQEVLNQALATASDIVVDLLWVEQIDPPALQCLAQTSQRAAQLGKSLAFVAMDAQARRSLEQQLLQEHQQARGGWDEQVTPELENFLNKQPTRRRKHQLSRELLSQHQW